MTAVDALTNVAVVPGRYFLHHLNPLSKIAAVLPAMVALIVVRDVATPLALIVLALVLTLAGTQPTRRRLLTVGAVLVAIVVVGLVFAMWVDSGNVETSEPLLSIGSWTLYAGAVSTGMATSLRLGGILVLALMGGLNTTGPDLVRASIQQLRIPYRIGYTALAAYRFVPRFGYELSVIRAAHRVRHARRGVGVFSAVAKAWGYVVPLLAGAIRHAERGALSMEARAFGAYPTRTERYPIPWRTRDWVFSIGFIVATTLIIVFFSSTSWRSS